MNGQFADDAVVLATTGAWIKQAMSYMDVAI